MAEINILLQGLSKDDDHDTAVNELLQLPLWGKGRCKVRLLRFRGVHKQYVLFPLEGM